MKALTFEVPGLPQPKERPRARAMLPSLSTVASILAGAGNLRQAWERIQSLIRATMYTPRKTAAYEKRIRENFEGELLQRGRLHTWEPWEGGVHVQIMAAFEPAASWAQWRRRGAVHPLEPVHHVSRPDLDNIAKVVLDALNGVAFVDDRKVFRLDVRKRYAEAAGLTVGLWFERDMTRDETEAFLKG